MSELRALAISPYFSPESAAAAAIGGALLGITVVLRTMLTGQVLGITGITRGLLTRRPPVPKVVFLLGLVCAGPFMAITYGSLEPMPPVPATASAPERVLLIARLITGGFLVGLGTALGNGCTSGHGLTGLARLSPRSWVAVPVFMASASAIATLSGSSSALPPSATAEDEVQDLPVAMAAAAAMALGLLLCGVLNHRHVNANVAAGRLAVELCSGMVFGCALVISSMARPSKVVAFLDLGSGAWDPSLAFVMGCALLLTFPFFQVLERRASPRTPWLGGTLGLPQTNPVDLPLVLGAVLFGFGWGLCGMCPGPLWVLLLGRPSIEVTCAWLATMAGMGAMVALKQQEAMQTSVPLVVHDNSSGPGRQGLAPHVRDEMTELGVEIPVIPGDMAVCGVLPKTVVGRIAHHFEAWLYLNTSTDPNFHPDVIESANCKCEVIEMTANPPPAGFTDRVLATLSALPRPLMLQCTSGNRASVLVLVALLSERGRSKESAEQLAMDLDLKAFTRCNTCGPICSWALQEVSASKAAVSASTARAACIGDVSSDATVEGASASLQQLAFKQLFDSQSSTFTYLLGCQDTKEAVLIDPVLEQKDRDLAIVDELGLDLKYVLNTHCHADHVTAGGEIRKSRPFVQTVISRASGASADVFVDHGDTMHFGAYALQVIATPGHTDGCVTFYLSRPGCPSLAFTGDTLLIRGCGRTDFQQGDAALLYNSVHERLFTLPGATQVYLGHDYKGRNMSTIEEERRFNPRLTKTEEEFIELMSNLQLPSPKLLDVAVPMNMACGVQP